MLSKQMIPHGNVINLLGHCTTQVAIDLSLSQHACLIKGVHLLVGESWRSTLASEVSAALCCCWRLACCWRLSRLLVAPCCWWQALSLSLHLLSLAFPVVAKLDSPSSLTFSSCFNTFVAGDSASSVPFPSPAQPFLQLFFIAHVLIDAEAQFLSHYQLQASP